MRAFLSREFGAFLLSGGVAALANLAARWVFNHWVSFSTAVVLAYGVGMVTAFVLARRFVFPGSRHSVRQSALAFTGVNLLAVAQTWAVSMALLLWGLPALGVTRAVAEIAHLVGVIVPVFTSYLGHKHWSFRR